MRIGSGNGFRFGLEVEFLLVDAASFRPLWHTDLKFDTLNTALEAIPADEFQCDSFKVEPPHRSSARTSSTVGNVIPSILAAVILMTSSTLMDC
jgi:hypothetical protein